MKKEVSNTKKKNANKKKDFNNSFIEMIKKFFSNIRNIIIVAVIVIILIIIMLVLFLRKDEDDTFSLNAIYDVYPEEVRELYSNVVSVSCYGDLHLDIELDGGMVDINSMKDENLIDYVFSYLEKNNKLSDSFDTDVIEDATELLFSNDVDFLDKIKNYNYGDYAYTVSGKNVTRTSKECKSDMNYVSHLYGYSYNEELLSVDINIGYSKKGNLYSLANKKLGEYDGDVSNLGKLFGSNSYYRLNFVKDGKNYKLDSVEWKNRS